MTWWILDTNLQLCFLAAAFIDLTPWPLSPYHPHSQKVLAEKIELTLSEKWRMTAIFFIWWVTEEPSKGPELGEMAYSPRSTCILMMKMHYTLSRVLPTFCNYLKLPQTTDLQRRSHLTHIFGNSNSWLVVPVVLKVPSEAAHCRGLCGGEQLCTSWWKRGERKKKNPNGGILGHSQCPSDC